VSLADILKLQRQASDLESQIINKRNKYLQDTQAEFSKVEEDLSSTLQLMAQRQDQLSHTDIKSPTNGVVKNVRFTTLGAVIKPSEEVMQIVPIEDSLVIEAKIKPSDVAFLKLGLKTNIKIDAYDYTIYGSLNGKLIYISADTLSEDTKQGEQTYYRIQVQTEGKTFNVKRSQDIEIQPGMTATVEIKTGENTILNYLIKPIIKTMNESMGER
jgi:adhesin transport system membrane fusion protein